MTPKLIRKFRDASYYRCSIEYTSEGSSTWCDSHTTSGTIAGIHVNHISRGASSIIVAHATDRNDYLSIIKELRKRDLLLTVAVHDPFPQLPRDLEDEVFLLENLGIEEINGNRSDTFAVLTGPDVESLYPLGDCYQVLTSLDKRTRSIFLVKKLKSVTDADNALMLLMGVKERVLIPPMKNQTIIDAVLGPLD